MEEKFNPTSRDYGMIANEPSTVKDHALLVKAKKWKKFPQHKGKGKKPQGKHSHFHSHLSKVICFNCKRLGHYAKYCRNPPSQQKRRGRFHASVVTEEEESQKRRTSAATKNKNNAKKVILFQPSSVLSPNRNKFG
jgi:hypothetical protein